MAGHARYTALLDACVLFPIATCNALMSVAGKRGISRFLEFEVIGGGYRVEYNAPPDAKDAPVLHRETAARC